MRVDLHIAIPKGFYGRIVGRSGLANSYGVFVFSGTIDADYRGVVCVVLFNLSDEDCEVRKGNRIDQIIIERCYAVKFVEYSGELPETERAAKGFGSSLGF